MNPEILEQLRKNAAASAAGQQPQGDPRPQPQPGQTRPHQAEPQAARPQPQGQARSPHNQQQRPPHQHAKATPPGAKPMSNPTKSAKSSTWKVYVFTGIVVVAMISVTAVAAPGFINFLLQPWEWAIRQMLGGVLNTVAWIPFLAKAVAFSTKIFALAAYSGTQMIQIAETMFDLVDVRIPPGARSTFRNLRTMAYGWEAPINFFYCWTNYSEGIGRIDSWILRLLAALLMTLIQTLVFEKFVETVGNFIKAVWQTLQANRSSATRTIDHD